MKSNLRYVLFILSLVFLYNCSEPGGEEPEPTVTTLAAQPATLLFEAAGGTKTISVTSNTVWSVSSSETWCTPSITSSKANASVTITADASYTTSKREALITISANDADDVFVSVTQEAYETDPKYADYIEPDNTDMRNITAFDLSQEMVAGWNLGNTLESLIITNGQLSGSETSWGNPVVTQTLIDSVKEAGFNAIRIPVSWSHKIEDESTYRISDSWKERVEEVVNYALTADMYVIMNIHWDGGWMDHPDNAHKEAINTKLAALWKQIAIHFRDYDDRLLFAGTNEVHVENDYGTPSAANVEVQNSFNQTFVNTVRATGGRNAYRHLVIQAFNTNIQHCVDFLIMPEDEIADKLFVEVHYYDPYDFTLQEGDGYTTQWGQNFAGSDVSSWGQEDWVDATFAKMKSSYNDQNIPVILGEFGAILRSDLTAGLEEHKQSRLDYLGYVTKAAKANGMIPFYWDSGYTGNNGTGIFNRNDGSQAFPEVVDILVKSAQ
ncbi:cellulase family glycosylhydrolase [Draconibacterium sp. IB214405]|uniref:cellulase family glycosylhydrolase n=1 Tax=Draconibacterium sp. IB214405 TaxID=3097352 RepID=UPI002A14EC30|nr:cellulase family glycosylhydrolase [Draconibacterium sp. IB214405]MDX8338936.1 cellulase family glycosylhydrolase [Draconibacterium sp. IB214405]